LILDDLLVSKKITKEEYDIYVLFELSEMGKQYMNRMVHDSFMDCASPFDMRTEILAYGEGRRSIFREIKIIVENINNLLGSNHD
jgi:hypothetical protein